MVRYQEIFCIYLSTNAYNEYDQFIEPDGKPGGHRHYSQSVLSVNGFALHSENLLTAMLVDTRNNIRKLAISRILKARSKEPGTGSDNIRTFRIPKINFSADDYYLLIDYRDDWLESRLTMEYSTTVLISYWDDIPIFNFSNYPNHTQSVERYIRIVSDTSKIMSDPLFRDERIRLTRQGN